MKILADLHHSGLFYSLHLLLENRLGHELYRPIGMDWFTEGYWDIAKPYGNNIGTARQYLQPYAVTTDGSPPVNQAYYDDKDTGKIKIFDTEYEYFQNAATLQQFKEEQFDIVIASIPDHAETYKRLCDQYQPKAKRIFQMGNMFNEIGYLMNSGLVENLMASTIPFPHPTTTNAVFYYQEQPLVDFEPIPTETPQIASFVHLLPEKELFEQYEKALVDFQFRAYGASCRDGWKNGIQNVYKEMQKSTFIWHVKPGGDGYGWNWHSAFITGRPILTKFSDYSTKLGGVLFEDGITGYDLERRTMQENCELIRGALVEKAESMGEAARRKFDSIVSYEAEAEKVKKFLEELK